jgi:glucose-1-phosphate thymidylyltransferase
MLCSPGKAFIENDNAWLILGDNIFYGHGLPEILQRSMQLEKGGSHLRILSN